MSCCEKCRKKNQNKSDFEEAQNEGKITREGSIMCPYCGDVQVDDIYEYKYNNSDTYQCCECDKESDLSIETIYHYTTNKKQRR